MAAMNGGGTKATPFASNGEEVQTRIAQLRRYGATFPALRTRRSSKSEGGFRRSRRVPLLEKVPPGPPRVLGSFRDNRRRLIR
jgi:hypothetical protein